MKKTVLIAILVIMLLGISVTQTGATAGQSEDITRNPATSNFKPLVSIEIISPSEGAKFELTNQTFTPTADVRIKVRARGLVSNLITRIIMKQIRTDVTPQQSQEFTIFEGMGDPIEPSSMPPPSEDITREHISRLQTGEWTLEFTAFDTNGNAAYAKVHIKVLPQSEPNPGPVSIVDVEPKQGLSPILIYGTGSDAKYTAGGEVTIWGYNMEANDDLKVYVSPINNWVDPTYEDTAGLPNLEWVLYEAEIKYKGHDNTKGLDFIRFKIPNIPDMTPATTYQGALLLDSFNANWRVIVQDNWDRPERLQGPGDHKYKVYPDPFTSPALRGPAFRILKPEYPQLWGFNFENPEDKATDSEFEAVFGESAYYHILGYRIPNPAYWWIFKPIYMDYMLGGTCCGMSATSLRFYHGFDMVRYVYPAVYPIAVKDPGKPAEYHTTSTPHIPTNLWALIRVNHGVQMSAEFISAWLEQSESIDYHGDPDARYHELASGNPLDYIIRLRFQGKGHAVVPYAVRDNKIYVYDCNHPDEICVIKINEVMNTYEYHDGWSGNQLFTIPISIWDAPRHMPGLGTLWDWMAAAVYGSGTIITPTGSVGIDAEGNFTENNPEGWVWVPDGPGSANSFGLVMKGTAEPPIIQVDAGNTDFNFFAGEKERLLQLEINDPDGCDAGAIELNCKDELPVGMKYSTAGTASNIVPKIGLSDESRTVLFNCSGVNIENGKLDLSLNGANSVLYQNTGSDSNYYLVVNSVDTQSEEYGTYLYGPFDITSGAIHMTTLKNWPNCSSLVSEIDLDADGTVDMINEEVPGIKLDVPLNEQKDEDRDGLPDQFDTKQARAAVTHVAVRSERTLPPVSSVSDQTSDDAPAWGFPVWAVLVVAGIVAGTVIAVVLIKKGSNGGKKQ